MKTLIFNGSPKINGDTVALINEFIKYLHGEVKILSNRNNISPCIDCRYCWTNNGCKIDDEMQEVYQYIAECDNIIIASPIWFSSLSGIILNISSRLQTYFTARYFRNESVDMKIKNGVIILVGAEPGTELNPIATALTIMKNMNVQRPITATVLSLTTDNLPAANDIIALNKIRETALKLNEKSSL